MARSYKEFSKEYIGSSDVASLTLRSPMEACVLSFGRDGSYSAYICEGDDVEIGAHYTRQFSGAYWLKIFDDSEKTYDHYGDGEFKAFDVYTAGEMGCIIHWHSITEED